MELELTKVEDEKEKALSRIISDLKKAEHPNSQISVEDLVLVESKVGGLANDIKAKTGEMAEHKNLFVDIYHLLNKLFINENQKDKAEKNLVRAFKIDKANIETIFRMGQFYYEKEDFERAEKFFSRISHLAGTAIKTKKLEHYLLEKKYVETIFNLGCHYFKNNKFLKAEVLFNQVIQLAGMALKDYNIPLNQSIQATRLESDSWLYLGKIKQEQKKSIETIKLFENAIKVDGNDRACIALGETFYRLGRYDDALKYFEHAIKNSSQSVESYLGIFSIFEDEDKPFESYLELIDKTGNPESCAAYFLKGEVHLRFAKKNNPEKFKHADQTTVLYEVLGRITEHLKSADSFFSKAFGKKDSARDSELAEQIKEKLHETREYQKILKNYRKEKAVFYGTHLRGDSLDSFELYFKWSHDTPAFSSAKHCEDLIKSDEKNPLPHLYQGKIYLREAKRLAASDNPEERDAGNIASMIDFASKSLQKAKNLELEKGPLVKPIQDTLTDLEEFSSKKTKSMKSK